MRVKKLIKKIPVFLAQLAFTLSLTAGLGYCVLNLAPVSWVLNSRAGSGIHQWLLNSMGSKDLSDMLDTFTLMWLSMAPSLAIWICVLLTRYLPRRLSVNAPAQP